MFLGEILIFLLGETAVQQDPDRWRLHAMNDFIPGLVWNVSACYIPIVAMA